MLKSFKFCSDENLNDDQLNVLNALMEMKDHSITQNSRTQFWKRATKILNSIGPLFKFSEEWQKVFL